MLHHHAPILTALSFLCFVYSVYQLFVEMPSETNTCQMTYTRGPSYQVITLPQSQYNYKYKLYRFDQISLRANPTDSALDVSGIPVLFVPGHLGDYKQVRSLGSLADELGKRRSRKLEYFSLDFREEPSAFSAMLLRL